MKRLDDIPVWLFALLTVAAFDATALGGLVCTRRCDRVVINPALDWGNDPRPQGPRLRILGLPDNGTFAEFVKVPAANVFPRPAHLSDEGAAALSLTGLTAYRAVVTRGRVQQGETTLVLGIGGGVATFALLIAKRSGARVMVTSGRPCSLAKPANVIDYMRHQYATVAIVVDHLDDNNQEGSRAILRGALNKVCVVVGVGRVWAPLWRAASRQVRRSR
jgi:NADPH:quinone reductase-like Zn-dependent oxidoreductase